MDSDGIITSKNTTTSTRDLPHEMVLDILSRLPVRNLFKFRCVSKTWLQSITQDLHFAKLHLDRSINSNKQNPDSNSSTLLEQKNSLLMAIDHNSPSGNILIDFGLPFPQAARGKKRYDLCGACNGLLCYSSRDAKHVYIWNPLIRDYITISCSPDPPIRFPGLKNKGTQFGFGYDPVRNEYKVVRLFCEANPDQRDFHTQVCVYTLGVNSNSSWRTVAEDLQYYVQLGPSHKSVPFVNGVLHWLAHKAGTSSYDRVVGFDVKDEVFREIFLLTDMDFNDSSGLRKIGMLHGLVSTLVQIFFTDVQVWKMQEHGDSNSWIKVLRVAKPAGFNIWFYLESLQLALKGEDELRLECDPNIRKFTKSRQFAGLQFFHTHTYVGSIISPRIISGVAHNLTEKKTRRNGKRKSLGGA